jgi:hypothetical protein
MSENTAMMICQEAVLVVLGTAVFGGAVYLGWRALSRFLD